MASSRLIVEVIFQATLKVAKGGALRRLIVFYDILEKLRHGDSFRRKPQKLAGDDFACTFLEEPFRISAFFGTAGLAEYLAILVVLDPPSWQDLLRPVGKLLLALIDASQFRAHGWALSATALTGFVVVYQRVQFSNIEKDASVDTDGGDFSCGDHVLHRFFGAT